MTKKINFGAGPAKIPESVLAKAQAELVNFGTTGISILEMSHRSKDFENLLNETKNLLRTLMKIPDNYEVLFMQGGGSGQFAAIPLNIKGDHTFADYVVTGTWSAKAAAEAEKFITVKKAVPPKKPFTTIPNHEEWDHDAKAAYLYYCANETVQGIEFQHPPPTPHGVPLVTDISSNFLARPFDFTGHGIVYGGTQKNLGAAGLTIAIVRKDLIGKHKDTTPSVLCYKDMVENNSLYNTPPVFSIYITNLVLRWIQEEGGVEVIYDRNLKKSEMIYSLIDGSHGFYHCVIDRRYRSIMNICFRICKPGTSEPSEELEAEFLRGAVERHMISLKGHRSVGGIRASLYNAITLEETTTLANWMKEFQTHHH